MAQLKEKLLKEYLDAPISVGDKVSYISDKNKHIYDVVGVDGDSITIKSIESNLTKTVSADSLQKRTVHIGANPYDNITKVWYQTHMCSIGSFISDLNEMNEVSGKMIPEYNFYPTVVDKKGNCREYQRDYCWGEKEMKDFIDSIYNEVDCGVIVLRELSYEEVERRLKENDGRQIGFFDVIDGKQRLMTLKAFINDQFTDSYGNLYSDLSTFARRKFSLSNCIKKVLLPADCSDIDAIDAFLRVNYTGKAISREHIDYIIGLRREL